MEEDIDLGGFYLNSKEMVRQLKQDMKDDWFRDPLDFEDMLNPLEIKEKLVANINKNHGIYVPSEVLILDITKQNYLIMLLRDTYPEVDILIPMFDALLLHVPQNGNDYRKNLEELFVSSFEDSFSGVRAEVTISKFAD